MKCILDRSFVFRFVAGDPQYNIKDVIKSAGDPKFQPLHDKLMSTRKLLFCWRLLHYEDVILDVKLNVKNRSAELTKPLIRLFQNSPIALERILDSLSKFLVEKSDIKKNSFESKLYEVIKFLKEERKERLDKSNPCDDGYHKNKKGKCVPDKVIPEKKPDQPKEPEKKPDQPKEPEKKCQYGKMPDGTCYSQVP
jgi:hypothetical protein